MKSRSLILIALLLLMAGCAPAVPSPTAEPAADQPGETEQPGVDLAPVKDYATENGRQMQVHTQALEEQAADYYEILAAANFDYEAAWGEEGERLAELIAAMRESWFNASLYYELDEGIVAGVPSLAHFDAWIDAGPPASEAPDEAYVWTLELPDGETLESPGNLFHTLLEPVLYGTNPDFVGAEADLNGNGETEFTEVLPEANLLYGAAQALNGATTEMNQAIDNWEPTAEDAFTALVVMTPTMSEYFEQWKHSTAIAGEAATEDAFIGASRLFDITNILHGLDLTYDNLSPVVKARDAELDAQIQAGYDDLVTYVKELYEQEQAGTHFTAEQADLLGTEAQAKAQALSALVAQAAQESNIELDLE
jgi:hypothetical protein